ncbi:ClpXP adapter SpxH family protein [Shouchella lonarensis]|uniref:ClpXP adapter protein SpxH n=1 Tax=Shouchella lonarensis TaxID=1464122 RepID=A0A1G6GL99_9BACI|nr:ClpXP adapter SpxH family protein [Shouchella lonarensis]SDB82788.1 Predicted dithiol-disulfide isomerase, DsbA family [Shouchella lonarensis]
MNIKHYSHNTCDEQLGVCGITSNDRILTTKKPIEIYTFIDPLCSQCWSMEPILKKLRVEYGHYLKIRILVAGKLTTWNSRGSRNAHLNSITIERQHSMSSAGNIPIQDMDLEPFKVSLAIKAAELQGPRAGHAFLRKLREALFLKQRCITDQTVLITCAKEASLDVDAFLTDLTSTSAVKALQCDLQTTREMGVETVPTFVFFNGHTEEAGIKISGEYPFSVYVQVLADMLGFTPRKSNSLSLEIFLQQFDFVATLEVAVVLDLSLDEAERQLKMLLLQQKIEAVPFRYGTFWRWIR